MFDFQDGNPVTPRKHALMKLHERINLFVNYANFYEISQLHDIHFNYILIMVLVER